MKVFSDANLRRDLVKLLFGAATLAGAAALFLVTPSLTTPTMLSIVVTMLLSPMVAALERRGYKRALSIMILFGSVGIVCALGGAFALKWGYAEWSSFKEKAPEYFHATMAKLRAYEDSLKLQYPFLKDVHPTDSTIAWGKAQGTWFMQNGAALVGDIMTCAFIVPLLTFVLLNEGPAIRKRFFQLVPNRFFETTFLITTQITTSISDYLRAKLIEAFLVGLISAIGLAAVGAPYAVVLGVLAGVTNILPYLGPVLGAVPGILIAALDPANANLVWAVAGVYVAANVIDNVLIFPVIVAKLVNLHPLILIAVVFVGQQYYGLVGMLISTPIAAAIKVIVGEIYTAVYGQRSDRGTRTEAAPNDPRLKVPAA